MFGLNIHEDVLDSHSRFICLNVVELLATLKRDAVNHQLTLPELLLRKVFGVSSISQDLKTSDLFASTEYN